MRAAYGGRDDAETVIGLFQINNRMTLLFRSAARRYCTPIGHWPVWQRSGSPRLAIGWANAENAVQLFASELRRAYREGQRERDADRRVRSQRQRGIQDDVVAEDAVMAPHIGERSDAVLQTAMAGHDVDRVCLSRAFWRRAPEFPA